MSEERDAYAEAGVNLAAAAEATAGMKDAVQATYGPEVLAGLGAFGGLYDAGALKKMDRPVSLPPPTALAPKPKSQLP